MERQTLILNPYMQPHAIWSWQRGVQQLAVGKIYVVEAYEGEIVRSAYLEFPVPSVACLRRPVGKYKKGVKFSRINVFTRDRFTCQFCGRGPLPMKHLNYDHVLPRVRGGKTVWENIVTSCYPCNERKGKRTPEEAGMRLLHKPYKPSSLPMGAPVWKTNLMPEQWAPYLVGTPELAEQQTA